MNHILSSILILAWMFLPADGMRVEAAPTNSNGVTKTNATAPVAPSSAPLPAATKEAPAAPSTQAPAEAAGPNSSATLTSEAWQALDKKDFATAKERIAKCRELYEAKAVEMQAGLTTLPPSDKAHSYWALNDVGTCLFILGKVTEAEGKPKEALEYYQKVVDRFPMAQCWDKQGWFWQPAVAAKERIVALTLESTE